MTPKETEGITKEASSAACGWIVALEHGEKARETEEVMKEKDEAKKEKDEVMQNKGAARVLKAAEKFRGACSQRWDAYEKSSGTTPMS